jgi:hypothetical protein
MSNFLVDKYKKTITLKQLIYSEIKNRERHHIAISTAALSVDDVVIFESEADQMLNAQHPVSAKNTWAIITTKETFAFADKMLCVYGFNSIDDLPAKFIDLANNIYKANISLQESNIKMMHAGVELL